MDHPGTPPAAASPDERVASSPPEAVGAPLSIWRRPVSYRAQCWVAWAGLTVFGVRGLAAMYSGAEPELERLIAVALSVVWGIDLVRARSTER